MNEKLYLKAEDLGHRVYWYPFSRVESVAVGDSEGYVIGLNPRLLRSRADERVKLAHELGHCETGSFYGRGTRERARCEERAARWAIRELLPFWALRRALREGDRTESELAERFGVTEDFLREALRYYRDARDLYI